MHWCEDVICFHLRCIWEFQHCGLRTLNTFRCSRKQTKLWVCVLESVHWPGRHSCCGVLFAHFTVWLFLSLGLRPNTDCLISNRNPISGFLVFCNVNVKLSRLVKSKMKSYYISFKKKIKKIEFQLLGLYLLTEIWVFMSILDTLNKKKRNMLFF